jgi:hypothetical protein
MDSKTIVIIASIAVASSVVSSTLTAIVMQPKEATASKDENLIASIPLGQRAQSSSTLAKLAEDSRGVGAATLRQAQGKPPTPRVAGASTAKTEANASKNTSLGIFESSEEQEKKVVSVHEVNKSKKETSKKTTAKKPESQCAYTDGSSASQKELIFNEINWAGSSDNSNAEWIELKNISGKELDVSGYEIIDLKEQVQIKIPAGVKLPAHALYLLKRGEDTLPSLSAPIYTGALSNSSEGLKLFNNNCSLEDEALAEPSWPAGDSKERFTMEREGSLDWHSSKSPGGTPAKTNSEGREKDPKPKEGSDFEFTEEEEEEENNDPDEGIFEPDENQEENNNQEEEQDKEESPSEEEEENNSNESNTSTSCIDINSASLEELDEIKWIGPATAQNIIDARPFASIDELDDKVSGIGESKLADIIAEGKACVQ